MNLLESSQPFSVFDPGTQHEACRTRDVQRFAGILGMNWFAGRVLLEALACTALLGVARAYLSSLMYRFCGRSPLQISQIRTDRLHDIVTCQANTSASVYTSMLVLPVQIVQISIHSTYETSPPEICPIIDLLSSENLQTTSHILNWR